MTLEVANVIYAQMGGNRLSAMIGVKHLVGDEKALTIQFKAKAKDGINCVKITLDVSDTYSMTYYKIKKFQSDIVTEKQGIYADRLCAEFEGVTGLRTALS